MKPEKPLSANTETLRRARGGDSSASNALMELTYDKLRQLAAGWMRRERREHTLQATALVHEAYLHLIDETGVEWQDREHFISIASAVMRRVLVDHARGKAALKRGGNCERVPLEDTLAITAGIDIDLLALDEALERLNANDERKARVVELRFFGGLTTAEAARVLDVSERTAEEDWYVARAWLHRELTRDRAAR